MGIVTDLSRVKSNITAALAAIAEKGVTVPDGSNSDALAELIASIEAGSGGEYIVEEGQFVPTQNVNTYGTIEHSLGVAPFFYGIFLSESSSMNITVSTNTVILVCGYVGGNSYAVGKHLNDNSYNARFNHSPVISDTATTEKYIYAKNITINGSQFMYIAGKTYKWIAIGRRP